MAEVASGADRPADTRFLGGMIEAGLKGCFAAVSDWPIAHWRRAPTTNGRSIAVTPVFLSTHDQHLAETAKFSDFLYVLGTL
ncbi:MAG: hypothetical protein EOS11_22980 [Mesorhizobium sp.]|uniref:hypothetical protein n=1 Tax=Mesorhizobium sp. TaxID=1871066 RepID=UPI000FE40680|nr:hypothetical protein [Mesorhizobium sp.]RWO39096.1 MAG: hypothetical protein EOS11_22980 [Mesorhizobium sp.]TIN75588.1 MAG: hypothetical protein E5Y09_27220 [Mesorhizobium sp.]